MHELAHTTRKAKVTRREASSQEGALHELGILLGALDHWHL